MWVVVGAALVYMKGPCVVGVQADNIGYWVARLGLAAHATTHSGRSLRRDRGLRPGNNNRLEKSWPHKQTGADRIISLRQERHDIRLVPGVAEIVQIGPSQGLTIGNNLGGLIFPGGLLPLLRYFLEVLDDPFEFIRCSSLRCIDEMLDAILCKFVIEKVGKLEKIGRKELFEIVVDLNGVFRRHLQKRSKPGSDGFETSADSRLGNSQVGTDLSLTLTVQIVIIRSPIVYGREPRQKPFCKRPSLTDEADLG
jgi:hypothetical protein